ncbi:MIP/aquaporin family protein [Lactiplantibacillus plantarum]|uniref:MIP/aquaporin family protein n=1 Tax=Lactiplantibacillus plantarum TaxID=1590 RepID=UPI003B9FDF77
MTGSWEARYAAEFFGTLILVLLGNGAVANAFLKNTTGNDDPGLANGGWLLVASGYGLGVMLPAMMFGSISGNHLNPAITIGQATVGLFPWPHYRQTTDAGAVLGTFATSDAAHSQLNGFITEMVGTAVLIFGAMGLYRGMFFHQNIDIANIGVGLLIAAMVISLGGPTGPALNPARDLGPRLVHALLPVPNKGSSHWEYSWVPVVAPIVGAVIGIWLYKIFFSL